METRSGGAVQDAGITNSSKSEFASPTTAVRMANEWFEFYLSQMTSSYSCCDTQSQPNPML